MQTKFCRDCGEHRPVADFSANRRSRDGLAFYCRDHLAKRAAQSREARRGERGRHRSRPPDVVVPSGHKWCPDCGEVKAFEAFARSRASRSGVSSYCLPCHNERGKRDVARRGGSRTYHLSRRYGITAAEADLMLERQGGLCAICGTAPAAHVDHDHETGAVRSLLCFNCNGGLGQFRDDPAVLRAAADYVEEHRRRGRPQTLRARRDEVTSRPAARHRWGPQGSELWSPMCTRLQAYLDALAEA